MDFHFAKIYPSYNSSKKIPRYESCRNTEDSYRGFFYALNYFISYSNRTGKHQDKEDSIAFVLWNPPLLYLEYHFFIFQSENIRYGLEYHLSIYDIQTPIQGFILLAGLSPTLISKR